ncbi:ThuA domain-containing protein [Streptomyces sp. NPDC059524]|uniref:ThuA domain-containing protein n=1 Tax=Streptomyces sp. NPDC059524 TaxID=3346856 RepID=UPI0036868EC0
MPTILVHTRTTGYRHASIPHGVRALRDLGFGVRHAEDPDEFADALGQRPGAVVFLSTTGEVLTDAGRERLAAYVDGGGGFVGVHAAACAEYGWPYFGELLGARFTGHPAYQPGRVLVTDRSHPATRHLPPVWNWTDEWYDFDADPARDPAVRVLARADESSYTGAGTGPAHPLIWCRPQGAGRVFYTSLGHAPSAYEDPAFRTHLAAAVTWAARADS